MNVSTVTQRAFTEAERDSVKDSRGEGES